MRMWEQSGVFEELDSDEEDDAGVPLSETLHFTGADIGRRPRRTYNYNDESDESDDDSALDQRGTQIALRHKEEELVRRALERINRARAMGKTNVSLTEHERDALERMIENDRAQGRKPPLPLGSLTGQIVSERSRPSSKASSRSRSGKKSARSSGTQLDQLPPNPPGYMVPGPDGQLVFTPIGSYGPGVEHVGSSHNGSHRNTRRYVSGPDVASTSHGQMIPGPRTLPDDPNWQPRPRSHSSHAMPGAHTSSQGYYYPPPAVPHRYRHGDPRGSDQYGNPRASDPGLVHRDHHHHHHRHRRPERTPSESEGSSGGSDGGANLDEVNVVPDEEGRGYEVVQTSRRTSGHSTGTTSSAPAKVRRKGKK